MTTFCEHCRQDVFYYTKQSDLHLSFSNRYDVFLSQLCYCSICNQEVYVAQIEDQNLKLFMQMQKKQRE